MNFMTNVPPCHLFVVAPFPYPLRQVWDREHIDHTTWVTPPPSPPLHTSQQHTHSHHTAPTTFSYTLHQSRCTVVWVIPVLLLWLWCVLWVRLLREVAGWWMSVTPMLIVCSSTPSLFPGCEIIMLGNGCWVIRSKKRVSMYKVQKLQTNEQKCNDENERWTITSWYALADIPLFRNIHSQWKIHVYFDFYLL